MPRPRRRLPARLPIAAAAAVALAAAVLLAACGQTHVVPPQTTPSPVARLAAGTPAHIAIVVMENEEYGDVIGDRSAPFLNHLAAHSALATQMYTITHPSLPNYLALTGGSTFGIDSDCTDCRVRATSLVDQLERARLSWRAYMEDLPRPCFAGSGASDYAKKHDPFSYYTRIARQPTRCDNIVPLSRLRRDERTGSLPRLSWITPNLCHDMHDCDVATGDRFIAGLVPGLLRRLGAGGLLFITWDEGSSDDGCCRLASGGHVVTIVAGPGARPGARLHTAVDHYSVLQTVEDLLQLPRLRGAACSCTPSLAPLLRSGRASAATGIGG